MPRASHVLSHIIFKTIHELGAVIAILMMQRQTWQYTPGHLPMYLRTIHSQARLCDSNPCPLDLHVKCPCHYTTPTCKKSSCSPGKISTWKGRGPKTTGEKREAQPSQVPSEPSLQPTTEYSRVSGHKQNQQKNHVAEPSLDCRTVSQ